ncbi:MAG: hypothetical protein WDN72_04825 [Alphaproteobacteria bacterium]
MLPDEDRAGEDADDREDHGQLDEGEAGAGDTCRGTNHNGMERLAYFATESVEKLFPGGPVAPLH